MTVTGVPVDMILMGVEAKSVRTLDTSELKLVQTTIFVASSRELQAKSALSDGCLPDVCWMSAGLASAASSTSWLTTLSVSQTNERWLLVKHKRG